MTIKPVTITLRVNGQERTAKVEPRTTLVDVMRDHLCLTGTHVGCEHGVCGVCAVLLDGRPVRSCCIFGVRVDGQTITTVEGLAPARGEMSPLQGAFCEKYAMQWVPSRVTDVRYRATDRRPCVGAYC